MSATVHQTLTDCQAYERRPTAGLFQGAVARIIRRWRNRIREREAFANLDYRDLRDIGISRWEIERELAKPFWRG
jgi:uncharacterized protein YjiS (DUF1127 family)